jgi:hypothetical protein
VTRHQWKVVLPPDESEETPITWRCACGLEKRFRYAEETYYRDSVKIEGLVPVCTREENHGRKEAQYQNRQSR